MLSPNRALVSGLPTVVSESINATGITQARGFSPIKNPMSKGKVTAKASGTFTVLNGTVDASIDGGSTWGIHTAFDFIASPIIEFETSSGILYTFNVLNITSTVAPSISVVLA